VAGSDTADPPRGFRLSIENAASGFKTALFLDGAFNCREYYKERVEHGWPVHRMWTMIITGLALPIIGMFITDGLGTLRNR
jgi:hypothetical protein